MLHRLPRKQFKKSLNELKEKSIIINSKFFFHLSIIGNVYKKEEQLIQQLWLFHTNDAVYPVKHKSDAYICIEIKAHFFNQYPYGAIYDHEGYLVNTPENSFEDLEEISIKSVEMSYKDSKFYKNIKKTFFKTTPRSENVLYKYPYYLYEKDKVKVLIPINIIISYFFFSPKISSTTIYNFLRKINLLSEIKTEQWSERREKGILFQPNNIFRSSKELKNLFQYLFTISENGENAIKTLAEYHHTAIRNRVSGFLNTIFPYGDTNVELIGQFIDRDRSIFHCYYIKNVFPEKGKQLYRIKKILVEKEKKTSKNIKSPTPIKLSENSYHGISDTNIKNDAPYNPSSPGIDLSYDVPSDNQANHFLPSMEIDYIGNKDIESFYVNNTQQGTDFDSLTGDYDNSDSGSTSVQAHISPEEIEYFDWDQIVIKVLTEICNENKNNGYFLHVDNNSSNNQSRKFSFNNYHDKNVFSFMPNNSTFKFRFLLFEFEFSKKFYYFLDRGLGKLSAMFVSEANMNISSDNIKRILSIVYSENYRGNWTSKELKKELYKLDLRILVYPTIKHKTSLSENNDNRNLIDNLKKRILNRIKTNLLTLKPL